MKKIISFALVFGMLLSVMGVFSVSAEAGADRPYVFMDFEEDNVAQLGSTKVLGGVFSNRTWKADGANGSLGCVSYTAKAGQPDEVVNVTTPFKLGQTYRVSVWVRYVTPLQGYNPVVSFFLYSKIKDGGNAWKEQAMSKTATVGDWNLYTTDFLWDGSVWAKIDGTFQPTTADLSYDPVQFRIRVGSAGGGLYEELKKKDPYKDDGEFVAKFDIDDIKVEPLIIKPEAGEKVNLYGANKLTYSTFDNPYPGGIPFSTGYAMGNDAGANKAVFTSKNASPVSAESGSYMNVASPDGAYAFNELMFNQDVHANIVWSANHMYEIKFNFRSNEMVTKNNTTATKGHMAVKIQATSATLNTTDVNGLSGMEAWAIMPNMNILPLDGQWHTVTIPFQFELKTFAELYRNGNPLLIGMIPYINPSNRWDPVHLDMDIDNLVVTDLGPITNGDMETGSGRATRTYRAASAPAHKEITYDVFGWNAENANLSQSENVSADSTGTKSMQVTATADGGKAWQGIALEKSIPKYKLSFRAKAGDSVADGESVPFAMVLDRYAAVTEQAQEYYDTPNYEFYTGSNTVIKSDEYAYAPDASQEWKLTDEWQYFECVIDNTFDAIPGHENVNTSKIKPRQPFMYFDVNGNAAGTQYYIDDVYLEVYEEPTKFEYPYVENIQPVSGEMVSGETVTISYDFVSEKGLAEKETVGRVMIANAPTGKAWACIKQVPAENGTVTFTLPDYALGKFVKVEFMPVDETNLSGAVSEIALGEVKNAFTVSPTITGWTEMENAVNGKVDVEINLSTIEPQQITVILAVYNEKNKMVASEAVTKNVSYGDGVVSIPISTSYAGTDASHAKLYVWSGASVDSAGKTAYCDEISSVR